jgi:Kef-type K+ transport system membrane component KefB/nucleotide-binding universal stress UspA family protein
MHGAIFLLLIQITAILIAARLFGLLFRALGQPQVVGEMAAGIILGPSVFGWLAPGAFHALFPVESLGLLQPLSQLGLVLFMFLVGLELDLGLLRGRGHAALATSHASISFPFFFGALLALYLYPRLADDSIPFLGFTLFIGAAMSVTAFPVLARILTERNLLKTKMGAVTIACAAVDDVTAWCLLAIVIALVRAGSATTPLWATLGGTVVYGLAMVFLVRPLLGRLEQFHKNRGRLTPDILALVLLALLLSAASTEWLGIHALFGAFVIGAVMPRDRDFVRDVTEKLEDVTVVLLLPLFFALTGLRTQIGLVTGSEMWMLGGLVLLVAVVGKFGGSAIAARATGLSWRESGALGVLMNTRGLMELVILSIGLDLGLISPALFALMVLMALITTVMTTPLLELIYPTRLIRKEAVGEAEGKAGFNVLVPVALPSSGPVLLRRARALAPTDKLRVYGLHLRRPYDEAIATASDVAREAEALRPLLTAAALNPAVDTRPLTLASSEPGRTIAEVANTKAADLVLVGWHQPVLRRSILGGTVLDVLRHTRADVGVFVERRPAPWHRILVPFRSDVHDRAALRIAERMAETTGAELTILHVVDPASNPGGDGLRDSGLAENFPDNVVLLVVSHADPLEALVEVAREEYDLIVVGVSEAWGLEPSPFTIRHERLAEQAGASLLIVRGYTAPEPGAKGRKARRKQEAVAVPA